MSSNEEIDELLSESVESNVRPVYAVKTKGLKLPVLNTESLKLHIWICHSISGAVLRLHGILQGVMVSLDRRANTMVERYGLSDFY